MQDIKIDKIIRSKRKTVALIIKPDATLVVRAPMAISSKHIKDLVFKKRLWIGKKKKLIPQNNQIAKKKKFIDGEEFLYLGRAYQLKFKDCDTIELADALYFPRKHKVHVKEKIAAWYKQKALDIIIAQAERYSKIIGLKYKSIGITNAKKQWGSCSPGGSINFSWLLIMAPLPVIEAVVVHELIHLEEKNHAAKFWNKVKAVLPDYQQRKKWLKDNARFLHLGFADF